MAEKQQDKQQAQESESASSSRPRRRPLPMPSDDMIRNTIARSLTQIVVNMQNSEMQQRCRELLQMEDLTQGAHIRILAALEQIDEQRERKASKQKRRRSKDHN
ncbi:PREDICTED: uncharacterized protein LOC108618022 [Drosophila arizonae]|uniref:Uncharacterized protein LOC108618022 n=1 Tax=Drosophila arizonae TaxID=7263 RepID=A0ABM1PQC9_DROAR|nr:PREDICTED: uncharacterized protein LOC108618022 [Drosophila arizonae]